MKSTGTALLFASMVFVIGASSGVAEGVAPVPAPERIALRDLKPCGWPKLPARLRCGSIDLPFERADPSLGTIRIAFAVLPRRDRSSVSRGALIAIEGGPGYGSIGSANFYADTFGDLLKDRDLLLVDARGTGNSQAIDCPALQRGIGTPASLADCADQLGARFDSYRTAAIADDIDDIRGALGYGKVQVYGDSYGTYLAQSYAFRHGDTLSRLVLDSAYPVRGESPWYPSVWRTGIRSLKIACDRARDCVGDAGLRLDRFAGQLRRRGTGAGPFLDLLGEAGYSPPESYLRIDRMIRAYLRGDTGPYRRMTRVQRGPYIRPGSYSYGQEMTITCNDYPMIWNKASGPGRRRAELTEAIRRHPRRAFAPFTPRQIALDSSIGYLECLGAPKPGPFYEPPAAPAAPAPEIPVLVIAGELDNVTSPAEGRATAALFPRAKLFLWRNAGHVYSLYDPRSRGAVKIRRFLRR